MEEKKKLNFLFLLSINWEKHIQKRETKGNLKTIKTHVCIVCFGFSPEVFLNRLYCKKVIHLFIFKYLADSDANLEWKKSASIYK